MSIPGRYLVPSALLGVGMQGVDQGVSLALYVKAVDDNALLPRPLHEPGHLVGTVVRYHGTDQVEGSVDASRDAATSDDTEATKTHRGAALDGLTRRVGALPRHGALPAVGGNGEGLAKG